MDSSNIWYIDHICNSFQTFSPLKIEMIFLIFQVFRPFCKKIVLQKKIDADWHIACDTLLKMSLGTLSIWPCVNTFYNPYKKLTVPPPPPPQKKYWCWLPYSMWYLFENVFRYPFYLTLCWYILEPLQEIDCPPPPPPAKNIDADCHLACDTFLKMSLGTLSIWPCVYTL